MRMERSVLRIREPWALDDQSEAITSGRGVMSPERSN